MSVQLCVIRDKVFADIEVMAPDFGADTIWLWDEGTGNNRVDLSWQQMKQLRDVLNEILGRQEP